MKTLYQLEQEAQQAREELCVNMVSYLPISSRNAGIIADKLILASVAMVTYQFALGMQEVSGDGSGESLPEYIEKKMKSNIAANQDYLTGDGSRKSLPEVSQEERDSDGFIKWDGGDCPVDPDSPTIVKFRDGNQSRVPHKAGSYEWRRDIVERSWDIVAYKVAK